MERNDTQEEGVARRGGIRGGAHLLRLACWSGFVLCGQQEYLPLACSALRVLFEIRLWLFSLARCLTSDGQLGLGHAPSHTFSPPSLGLLEPLLQHDKSDAKFRGRFSRAEREITGRERERERVSVHERVAGFSF